MNSDTPQTNEELIDAAHCAECGYEVVLADAMRKLEREIVELGKEREELKAENERLKESVHGLGIDLKTKLSAINAHHLIYASKAEEIDQLKRELSEAREQMDTFINQWSETNNSLQRENLALSLAYQRQKDALSEIGAICRASQDNPGDEDVDWFAEIENRTHAALAETPDVSMLEKVVAALKLAYARGHYCDNVPCPGCECGHVLDSILGCTVSQDECEQFVTSHFIKVSTLQPDHQK